MSVAKEQQILAKTKRGPRGSTNNEKRLAAFSRGGKNTGADWGACDPAKLQGVIEGITALGGAVTFGLSRDQGAHSLTLLLDSEKQTLWFNGSADLDVELDNVMGLLEAMRK